MPEFQPWPKIARLNRDIWHDAARTLFKVTLVGDEKPKGSKE